jgi:hypothetical protein
MTRQKRRQKYGGTRARGNLFPKIAMAPSCNAQESLRFGKHHRQFERFIELNQLTRGFKQVEFQNRRFSRAEETYRFGQAPAPIRTAFGIGQKIVVSTSQISRQSGFSQWPKRTPFRPAPRQFERFMELTDKLAVSNRSNFKIDGFPNRGNLPFWQAQRQFERLLALGKKFVLSTRQISRQSGFLNGQKERRFDRPRVNSNGLWN